jgi:RimJ/RimL family protein N-acetyltransferase
MSSHPLWPQTFADFTEHYDRMTRDESVAEFAIDVDGALVGRCALFSVDPLARHAKLGISFGPEHQGLGYGRDAVRVLVRYAFAHRNLRRVWLETLATNVAAQRAYAAAGFVEEGRQREQAWVDGEYVDVVLMAVHRGELRG